MRSHTDRRRTEPWTADLRRLAALPNTSAKLSGLVTEADWHHWKVADLRPYTELSPAEREAVFSGTATTVYRL